MTVCIVYRSMVWVYDGMYCIQKHGMGV